MAWGSIRTAAWRMGLGLLGITERVRELCGQVVDPLGAGQGDANRGGAAAEAREPHGER